MMKRTDFDRPLLIKQALEAREQAYAPYSGYLVGAALLGASGRVFAGANVENAVYPLATCAERVALVKAVSEGEREFVAIAVATENGGSPCGSCRQQLREFGADIIVVIADSSGAYRETDLASLLPDSFSCSDLEAAGAAEAAETAGAMESAGSR